MMKLFWGGLFVLGYILAVGPPRALYLKYLEDTGHGELSRQPSVIFLLIELAARLLCLMLIAVLVEDQLGKALFETLRLETAFSILGIAGVLHSIAYFVFIVIPKGENLWLTDKFYRVFRNIAYSCIPGLFIALLIILWEVSRGLEPYETGFAQNVYLYSAVFLIVIGFGEAVCVSRSPSAVDRKYKKREE